MADYPMSSTLAAEHTVVGSRARLILSVFSCNPIGALTSAIVYIILLSAFKSAIEVNINRLEWVWRLLLAIGVLPIIFTFWARIRMKETKPYEECKFFCNPLLCPE